MVLSKFCRENKNGNVELVKRFSENTLNENSVFLHRKIETYRNLHFVFVGIILECLTFHQNKFSCAFLAIFARQMLLLNTMLYSEYYFLFCFLELALNAWSGLIYEVLLLSYLYQISAAKKPQQRYTQTQIGRVNMRTNTKIIDHTTCGT